MKRLVVLLLLAIRMSSIVGQELNVLGIVNLYPAEVYEVEQNFSSNNLGDIKFQNIVGLQFIIRPGYIAEMESRQNNAWQMKIFSDESTVYRLQQNDVYTVVGVASTPSGRGQPTSDWFLKIRKYTSSDIYYLLLGTVYPSDKYPTSMSSFPDFKYADNFLLNYSRVALCKYNYLKNKTKYRCVNDAYVFNIRKAREELIKKDSEFLFKDLKFIIINNELFLSVILSDSDVEFSVPFKYLGNYTEHSNDYVVNLNELEKQKQVEIDYLTASENKEKRLTTRYGAVLSEKIINKELSLDMTTEMCIEAWGKPDDKHRAVTKTKITEVWVYPHDRLTFENGKLISIEQTSLLRVNR